MRGIEKSFAVPVLKGVDFSLLQGEVHALVGGNGAGKSTLMKVMTGVYSKDAGEIYINGEPVQINNIHDAGEHGIAMIFQELSLIQTMTVAENIFLGEEVTRNGFRDTAYMKQRTKGVLDSLGINVDPDTVVSTLSVGMSQMVEIAKAVSKNAKILVLDEPTASLSDSETEHLFKLIADLKKKGVSMVYISHRMNEILRICDSITILRDGVVAHTDSIKNIDLDKIIFHMLGSGRGNQFKWVEREYDRTADDLLTVEHMEVNNTVKDISFSLKPGEILGFAGLMGSGRTEILEALFGRRPIRSGTVKVKGKAVDIKSIRDSIQEGFALIPEDRRKQGLVLIHSVKENAILPKVTDLCTGKIWVDERRADEMVEDNVRRLNVITDGIHKRVNLLSGGNQQKIVVAKWLNRLPEIIMLDEPTAGVDIGAKSEIIELIRDVADEGKGVLFVSSELTELMAVCDRIIVLFDGRITRSLMRRDIKAEEELQHAIQWEQ